MLTHSVTSAVVRLAFFSIVRFGAYVTTTKVTLHDLHHVPVGELRNTSRNWWGYECANVAAYLATALVNISLRHCL
jgi:hypothetical protein